MTLTLAQAKALTHGEELHYTGPQGRYGERNARCTRTVGPRGGVVERVTRVRVSGAVRTWKRSPERVSVPVKYGLYESSVVTERNLNDWHLAAECPLNATDGAVPPAPQPVLTPREREIRDARETIQAAAAMMRAS